MLNNGERCPVCETGTLHRATKTERFEYKGSRISLPDYIVFECDVCGEALVDRKTIRTTEKILTDFRRRIDGLLTSDEIKAIREKLGKTQTEMAKLLEVGEKTFARYENGQVTQNRSMDYLLRMLDNAPQVFFNIKARKKEFTSYELLHEPSKECSTSYKVDTTKESGKEYELNMEIKRHAA